MPAAIIICNPCWPGEASNKFKTRKLLKLAVNKKTGRKIKGRGGRGRASERES